MTTSCFPAAAVALASVIGFTSLAAADLSDLVAPGAEARKVAGGFRFTEGPAWSPDGFLLFSDIPADRIVRLVDGGETEAFIEPSGAANGLAFDRAGRLYACQGGARQVSRIDVEDKAVTPLASSYDGKKLNSPNDLALDGQGGLYFTDPRYGNREGLEQPVMGVYHVSSSGDVRRVIDDLELPNGILVSPDGKRLHVADNARGEIHVYPIIAPGKLGDGKLLFRGDPELDGRRGPDGMAHDAEGNIWATYKGITVIDPEGEAIGRIAVPERPANCTFGGKERRTLYITARTGLYAVETKVEGAALEPGEAGTTGRKVEVGSITLEVPQDWKMLEPTSRFRAGEFRIPAAPGADEGAELTVYHFGGGAAGGGADDNIRRWIGQFDAEGREARLYRGKAPAGEYVLLDLSGTYRKPVGPPVLQKSEPMPGARVINVMLMTGEGSYFLKLVGPARTVAATLGDFRRSFGADAAREKEEDL